MLGKPLPYDTLAAVRDRLAAVNPVFAAQGLVRHTAGAALPAGKVGSAPFTETTPDYYQTNAIARASLTMAECSRTYAVPMLQAAE